MKDPYATPASRSEVYALLDTAFPGIAAAIPEMEPLGAAWHENSTPFVIDDEGTPIAHVGVLEIDLVIEGTPLRVPGIHAVCTHPDHRGRGHARTLMERALAFVDERFETSILFADAPEMYAKFGFRTLPQLKFGTAVDRVPAQGSPFQPVDAAGDLDKIHRMLSERGPVSAVLGCVRTEYMFFCDLLLAGLGLEAVSYADDLDALAVYRINDGGLTLFDVVSRSMPTLEQILARVGQPVSSVRFGFTPDRLGLPKSAVDSPLDDDIFMVRGPWPGGTQPFRFPYLAHC